MTKNIKKGDGSAPKDQNATDVESRIKELEIKLLEYETGWKRALADYQNLQKRFTKEKEDVILRANETLIDKLTHVLAHLENLDNYLKDEGLRMTLGEFKYYLEEAGLQELNPKGEEFDSNTMDAIEPAPGEKNKVVEVMQKGYMINQKLIRPARVKVGNGEKAEIKPEPEEKKEN